MKVLQGIAIYKMSIQYAFKLTEKSVITKLEIQQNMEIIHSIWINTASYQSSIEDIPVVIFYLCQQEIVNSQECMVADIEDYYLDKRGSTQLQRYQDCHNKIQGRFLSDFVSWILSHSKT